MRSSAVPKDDRHHGRQRPAARHQQVAILGRPEGRPPLGGGSDGHRGARVAILGRPEGRPPLEAINGRHRAQVVAILGRPEGRPPQRGADHARGPAAVLRSSAVPKDDRHPSCRQSTADACSGCDPRPSRRTTATSTSTPCSPAPAGLRSSAVPKDDRHADPAPPPGACGGVAILGRPEGRPPPDHGRRPQRRSGVSILGRPEGRPPLGGEGDAAGGVEVAILGRPEGRPPRRGRVKQRASPVVAILGRPEGRPPLVVGGPSPFRTSSCDPRPSRRTTATIPLKVIDELDRQLRSSAVPKDDRHRRRVDHRIQGEPVAILGRPEGRPPRGARTADGSATEALRSSAVPKDDRHPHGHRAGAPGVRVAILGRPEGRPPRRPSCPSTRA